MLSALKKTGGRVVLSQIADGIWRQIDAVQDTVSETFFEPVIRLGVTGLARSGKTVFITSLVANLMDRGRMPALVVIGLAVAKVFLVDVTDLDGLTRVFSLLVLGLALAALAWLNRWAQERDRKDATRPPPVAD
jgi:hypothetical protein